MIETWETIAERYDRQYRKIEILAEQQNYRCCYCGIEMILARNHFDFDLPNVATIEHIRPKIKGGRRGYHNEVAACRLCNNVRSADDALEFFEWRLRHLNEARPQLQKSINR